MKKKIIAMIGTFVLSLGIISMIPMEMVQARETTNVDGSVLLDDAEESTGQTLPETRGQYLQTGSSRIVKSGTGKITVGGTTIAQKQVASIKISVIVERLVNGNWVSYTSWSASKNNTYSISTSKTLAVPRGYYYRVISIHDANSDRSTSNTDALYVS